MIIELWILAFLFALFFTWAFIKYQEMIFLGFVASLLFFFLGFVLFTDGVEYRIGSAGTFSINTSTSGNNSVIGGVSGVTYNYATFGGYADTNVIAIILRYTLVLGGIILLLFTPFTYWQSRKKKKKEGVIYVGDDE